MFIVHGPSSSTTGRVVNKHRCKLQFPIPTLTVFRVLMGQSKSVGKLLLFIPAAGNLSLRMDLSTAVLVYAKLMIE